MADNLIIRAFDVDLGDLIHVCIPKVKDTANGKEDFHILIDCGTLGSVGIVKAALERFESFLPDSDQPGKKYLDLIVVSHEHWDHIKGFDPEYFKNIIIGDIWMSAAMNPDHDQATDTNNFHSFVRGTMKSLADEGLSLHPDLKGLMDLYSIQIDGALTALRTTWPDKHGFEPKYVHAGMTGEDLELELDDTSFKILGPENEIDHYYFGKEIATTLNGFHDLKKEFKSQGGYNGDYPKNISAGDFRRLRSRMLSNALSFANMSGEMKNNTSAILMIEWKGRRLLFVGDLQWRNEYKEDQQNGGWNVAWHTQKPELDKPVDFCKIGHHGSINATPWNELEETPETEPGTILNAILPKVDNPQAQVIVSTNRNKYPSIPYSPLLVEIAKRAAPTKNYHEELTAAGITLEELEDFEGYEKEWLNTPQPLRTDFEELIHKKGYVEVEIKPV
jgi:hypothetical protein